METTYPAPKRWNNRIALVLASIALALSLRPYLFRDRVSYPGISFIRLLDDTGEPIGFIKAEYGGVSIARIRKDGSTRTEFNLNSDGSVTIELQKGDHAVARWSLSEDGDKFEKLP